MATNSTAHALEPIPLRTLVVLLKYEFMVSDPRYRKFGLFATSLSKPDMLEAHRHMFKMDGRSVVNRSLHRFLELEKPPPHERYPAATCEPHPQAGGDVHNLSWLAKELIFHETRNHDGCYKAIGLFQYFFDWCPAEQKVLIQVPDESFFQRMLTSWRIDIRSTLEKRESLPGGQHVTPITGSRYSEPHCVMGFLRPSCISVPHLKTSYYVADMARMQSMKNVCENLTLDHVRATRLGDTHPVTARLKLCAERTFQRWQKDADVKVSDSRETDGWCDYCGKGGCATNGAAMKRCIGCRDQRIYYCCDQHQEAAWALHRFTCGAPKAEF
ncbi:hypothetical protein BUE80_DR007767 [Diplocarpon rosae]|nr:hypothetical protein BUE80_DR007767 [Diplocarpon rosae]